MRWRKLRQGNEQLRDFEEVAASASDNVHNKNRAELSIAVTKIAEKMRTRKLGEIVNA